MRVRILGESVIALKGHEYTPQSLTSSLFCFGLPLTPVTSLLVMNLLAFCFRLLPALQQLCTASVSCSIRPDAEELQSTSAATR